MYSSTLKFLTKSKNKIRNKKSKNRITYAIIRCLNVDDYLIREFSILKNADHIFFFLVVSMVKNNIFGGYLFFLMVLVLVGADCGFLKLHLYFEVQTVM